MKVWNVLAPKLFTVLTGYYYISCVMLCSLFSRVRATPKFLFLGLNSNGFQTLGIVKPCTWIYVDCDSCIHVLFLKWCDYGIGGERHWKKSVSVMIYYRTMLLFLGLVFLKNKVKHRQLLSLFLLWSWPCLGVNSHINGFSFCLILKKFQNADWLTCVKSVNFSHNF